MTVFSTYLQVLKTTHTPYWHIAAGLHVWYTSYSYSYSSGTLLLACIPHAHTHTHTHTLLAPCCWLAQMNVWLAAGASDDAWGLYTGMITNCKCILQPLHTKGTTHFKHYNVIYMLRGWKSWLAHCRRIRRGPRIVLPKQILQQKPPHSHSYSFLHLHPIPHPLDLTFLHTASHTESSA